MSSIPLDRIRHLCDTIPPMLRAINEQIFSAKPHPEKWSKKEILGHLIDSATNNHQRFVRGQFEDVPFIVYNQVEWNKKSCYQQMDTLKVIDFWEAYNRHLVTLLQLMPTVNMQRKVNHGDEEPRTLEFILQDYVNHMEHHLKQILNY